jgi:hypothetical protein
MSELRDELRPLAFLVGTWRGEGAGAVPGGGGPDYPYAEELRIYDDGSPGLAYSSVVTSVEDGRWLHSETGWWRVLPVDADDRTPIELVLSRPTGVVEVLIGHMVTGAAGEQIELVSDVVARTPTSPAFTADRRLYAVRGGKLMYAIDLAAGDSGLVPHLAAALDREPL